jgi:hypothetical protein
MFALNEKWVDKLVSQPETGMGYHVVLVILNDGRRYDHVIVNGGYVTKVKGYKNIPFNDEDIGDTVVTPDRWDFKK